MARIALLHGAYSAKSVIADAQRCMNLYPEANQDDAAAPVTHYLTPGLTLRVTVAALVWRALYTATNGQLFGVAAGGVYSIDINWTATLLGSITGGTEPVSMQDNGDICVIVDGGSTIWWFPITSPVSVTAFTDAAVYATSRVCYLDGYFVFNRFGTNQFFISPPFWDGADPFDPLDIAAKIGGPDPINTIAVLHRELWLIGIFTSEIWYNSGGADFPFERQPGAFVDHGIVARFSIAQADIGLFLLHRDQQGHCIVMTFSQYQATRISNFALENIIQQYTTVTDAIGFTYQQEGHTFYVLIFPTANKTWVYDLATKEWHQRAYGDGARIRANCYAFAYGKCMVGDYATGALYSMELGVFTDNGAAIVRRRSYPHIQSNGQRISHSRFQLDMAVGTNLSVVGDPQVTLEWSDTRGRSVTGTLSQSMQFGATDQDYASLLFTRLGMARDRVYEVIWSFPYDTAIQGAWIETDEAGT